MNICGIRMKIEGMNIINDEDEDKDENCGDEYNK